MTPQEIAALRERLAQEYVSELYRCPGGEPKEPEYFNTEDRDCVDAFIAGWDSCEREVAAPLRAEVERLKNQIAKSQIRSMHSEKSFSDLRAQLAEKEAALGKLTKELFLEVIQEWRYFWMNQKQNSQADFENYFRRALGVDANMQHDLSVRLSAAQARAQGEKENE